MKLKFLALLLIFVCLTGCTNEKIQYQEISLEEAKKLMDTKECIILDVRTPEEFEEGHIKGAINLDHEDVEEKAHVVLPDKNALILVYCRSGRRSKIAAQALADMGYKNVREFGGINDWKYDIVKEN